MAIDIVTIITEIEVVMAINIVTIITVVTVGEMPAKLSFIFLTLWITIYF